jgi:hypothetical protein
MAEEGPSNMVFSDHCLLVFIPLCNPPPTSVGMACILPTTSGIWQRGWYVMSDYVTLL